ncbi:ethanolamine ammonia-lyase reactivating factor EutA [Symbiobacterium thermophilum]|uniref:ethanolamine ammonia-lyase reactivating factor EutA n=1 Tax=Symbiobacterium thermophilum TaxID=2734 RepID=UPI0035C71CB4
MPRRDCDPKVRDSLTSIGIDIGTTSTCLVVSRLTTARLGGVHALASVEITGREVLYRSPVIFTPLMDEARLDGDAIFAWVREQLRRANLTWGSIDSGAVIITGESARRENARAVVERLSGDAGRFVVATAGPQLEAILAGRGSGAAALSREQNLRVLNLDVGGGTTNGALFVGGEVEATVCAHVGGRLVRVDPDTARITGVSPPARRAAEILGVRIEPGQPANPEALWTLCTGMAEALHELIGGQAESELARALAIGPPPPSPVRADVVTFSGGTGRELYAAAERRSLKEVTRYGDIGPMLADALRPGPTCRAFALREPPETVYATVIGAGMDVLELSGSTIFLHAEGLLPLHNVPMVRPPNLDPLAPAEAIAASVRRGLAWFETGGDGPDQPVAVAFPGLPHPRFEQVRNLAAGLAEGVRPLVERGLPVIVVLQANIGNVLGHSLAALLPPGHPVICVDQIRTQSGDYLDIGAPLYGGIVVPVVVKSLVFHS